MILVDSNVLIDLFSNDEMWGDWSERMLADHAPSHEIAINPIIFAEVSVAFSTIAKADHAIASLGLVRLDLPYPAGFLAGKAFLRYRRQGGEKASPLPDFFIGAHAKVSRLTLLTRDTARYRTYFPDIQLLTPDFDPRRHCS